MVKKKGKASNDVIVAFIVEQIEAGTDPGKIKAKIGQKWRDRKIADRTFTRLHATAKEIRAAKVAEIAEELRLQEIELAKKRNLERYLDVEERKYILSDIAKADKAIEVKIKGGGVILCAIAPGDRMSAIDLLNKMEAVYVQRTKEEGGGLLIFKPGADPRVKQDPDGSFKIAATEETPGS